MPDQLRVEQVIVLALAVTQYEAEGVLDTASYMALTNAGLDADNIERLIEDHYNG